MSAEIGPVLSIRDVQVSEQVEKQVTIRGWIYRTRSSGRIAFVLVRDSTGVIQTIVEKKNVAAEDFDAARKALIESSVELTGRVSADERAPGGYEIHVDSFTVLQYADDFPITKDQSEEHLLNNRHLWIRSQELTAVMKVKASLLAGAREWLAEANFFEMTPPIVTTNACEGGTTLFQFKYFGKKAYLSQSAQMYLESLIFSHERVWSLTPSFRAEKSRTKRHLTEYWHLEGEEAWVGNEENMRLQEEMVAHMVHYAARHNAKELETLGRDPATLRSIETPFEKISYDRAIERLAENDLGLAWGSDLGTTEERALTSDRDQPLFIYNYPKEAKAFYMRENPDDPRTYLCADLLAPEGYGEIIGGSEREVSYEKLLARIEAEGIDREPYEWYLDLRKFGSVQHSGFGLGLERVVRWVCKLDHIRDAIPYPRTINRIYP